MAEMKFEQALKKLEEIVAGLENGDLNLDVSLKKYEEGVKLIRLCSKKLEEARRKVEILTRTGKGTLKAGPFVEEEE
jgi:exodeoxyribonuclease VII small subunit